LAIDYGERVWGWRWAKSPAAARCRFKPHAPSHTSRDVAFLLGLFRARGVDAIVLGIAGGSQASEETARARAALWGQTVPAARKRLELAVFEADERFSTAQAHNQLRDAGIALDNRGNRAARLP
jgi:RNase H-fold protein (predicted Holliday junction resolvase)